MQQGISRMNVNAPHGGRPGTDRIPSSQLSFLINISGGELGDILMRAHSAVISQSIMRSCWRSRERQTKILSLIEPEFNSVNKPRVPCPLALSEIKGSPVILSSL